MPTLNLEFQLPEQVVLSEYDAKMMLAAKLYDDGVLTSGQAAEMVGITKRKFIETVGEYGVSVFQATQEEAERDHRMNLERIKLRAEKRHA